MANKAVFSEQVEQLAIVVHALLLDDKTREAFAKEPLATLKEYGIEFKDAEVAKKVEADLASWASNLSVDDICPPWAFARTVSLPRNITITQSYVRANSITRATSYAYTDIAGEREEVIVINQPRVDAFVTQVSLGARISVLEARIAELEGKQTKL